MSVFNPEAAPRLESQEAKPSPASIRLDFFRHDAKEKESSAGPRSDDEIVRLTKTGREHATEVGKTKNPRPEMSVAYSSPRQRAMETALRHMLANEQDVTSDSSLEEIQALLQKNVKVGRKDVTTELLNFNVEGSEEYNRVLMDHYLTSRDSLHFIWKESDTLVKNLNDTTSTSYTRLAGNVADLVQKYVKAWPNWKNIVDRDPEKYAEFNNELQRKFGSHQGVLESFLMKVIEKTDGEPGVQQFIDSLPDKNGFGLSEGFTIHMAGDTDQPQMTLKWQDQTRGVSSETISQIIAERDEFNKST